MRLGAGRASLGARGGNPARIVALNAAAPRRARWAVTGVVRSARCALHQILDGKT